MYLNANIYLFGVAEMKRDARCVYACICLFEWVFIWHEESQFVVLHSKFHGAFPLSVYLSMCLCAFLQVHFNDLFYSMKMYLWRAAVDLFAADCFEMVNRSIFIHFQLIYIIRNTHKVPSFIPNAFSDLAIKFEKLPYIPATAFTGRFYWQLACNETVCSWKFRDST